MLSTMVASITSLSNSARNEGLQRIHPGLQEYRNENIFQERVPDPPAAPTSSLNKFWDTAKKYAAIVDSRESLVRLALEFFGGDIPWILAAALRNPQILTERIFECTVSLISFFVAPSLTATLAKLGGKIFMPDKSSEEVLGLINLKRKDLRDETSFNTGVERVLEEEPADKLRISQLYKEIGKHDQANKYELEANKLKQLFGNTQYDKDLVAKIKKVKEFTILAESQSEGILWGGFGLMLRAFRKYILKQDRFTGTKKYLNDKDAKKIGQADDLKLWQKIGGTLMMFLPSSLNYILMKLTDNQELVSKNKLLQIADRQLEMTHGLFPKIGLMFTYTSLPKWIGTFITSQGKDELIERVITFFAGVGSWWQGHKLFNGMMAKYFDNKLSKEFNTAPGFMVDKEYHDHTFVEPARIHQVLSMTDHNPNLQKKARDAHAKTLYAGITMHSLFVFAVSLAINQFTKWRVENKKAKLA